MRDSALVHDRETRVEGPKGSPWHPCAAGIAEGLARERLWLTTAGDDQRTHPLRRLRGASRERGWRARSAAKDHDCHKQRRVPKSPVIRTCETRLSVNTTAARITPS